MGIPAGIASKIPSTLLNSLSPVSCVVYLRILHYRQAMMEPCEPGVFEAQVVTVARKLPPSHRGWLAADISTKIDRS
jgi:hypothetical protein